MLHVQDKYLQAKRHSFRIIFYHRFLVFLPSIILIVTAFLSISPFFTISNIISHKLPKHNLSLSDFSFMLHPIITSYKDDKEIYNIVAQKINQDEAQPNIVNLQNVDANIFLDNNSKLYFSSDKVKYNLKLNNLVIDNNVKFHFRGVSSWADIYLPNLFMDISQQNLRSSGNITVKSEHYNLSGREFFCFMTQGKLILEKDVDFKANKFGNFDEDVTLNADKMTFLYKSNQILAEKKVKIKKGKDFLTCDKILISYNKDNIDYIQAYGHIFLKYGSDEITTLGQMNINFKNKKIIIEKARSPVAQNKNNQVKILF